MQYEFSLVVGTDILDGISGWRHKDVPDYAERVWNEVQFLVYLRDGYPLSTSGKGLPPLAKLIEPPNVMELITSNNSSSEIRNRIAEFQWKRDPTRQRRDLSCIDGLVPSTVLNYIVRNGLYLV